MDLLSFLDMALLILMCGFAFGLLLCALTMNRKFKRDGYVESSKDCLSLILITLGLLLLTQAYQVSEMKKQLVHNYCNQNFRFDTAQLK